MAAIDLKGQKMGRLVILGRAENDRYGRTRWAWRCDCGSRGASDGQSLRVGKTRSCGCLARARIAALRFSHGETRGRKLTPEYRAHNGMLRRCYEQSHISFPRYGARGIGVCDRWRFGEVRLSGFECFLADMGRRPSNGHSLDRWPDNNGDYEPGNVRWATQLEQSANSRRSRRVVYHGEEMTFRQAWEKAGRVVARDTAHARFVRAGWSVERSVETQSFGG